MVGGPQFSASLSAPSPARLHQAQPGDVLGPMAFPPLSRHDFALYCGGSGDHNPLHTDIDFAREVGGLEDVIGQGMLSMALAGRFLTGLGPDVTLESFSTRFNGKTGPSDRLICSGEVEERTEADGKLRLALCITMTEASGREILSGKACVVLPLIATR